MVETANPGEPILTIETLDVRFRTPDGEVHAVRGVDMDVAAGETAAVVGESGSGKSQIMLAAMGLLAANGRASGSVRYRGTEILGLPPRALNRFRGVKISMIFQEPMTALNPVHTIGKQLLECYHLHRAGMSKKKKWDSAVEMLHQVGILGPGLS